LHASDDLKGVPKMRRTQANTQIQRTKIVVQVAELSRLLVMIPSDDTIEFHAPLTEKIMGYPIGSAP
jgi:hypothetical protein